MAANNLFIIGSPRSGTTFLASLLKPTAYGEPFETQFILKYFDKLENYGSLEQDANVTTLLKDIEKERAIAQWQVPLNGADAVKFMGQDRSYQKLVDYIGTTLMASRGKQLWGDKTPHYILQFEKLVALYPDAKFLYIIRDGRDVALSLLQKDWGPNNVYACAQQWIDGNSMEVFRQTEALKAKGNLHYINYETLLTNPEQECAKIYQFLDDDIENYRDEVEKLIAKTMSGNFSKWKTKMSATQIEVYESVAGDVLNAHGYELMTKNASIGSVKRKLYHLHDRVLWLKHMFVQNVIDGILIKFFGKQPFNK